MELKINLDLETNSVSVVVLPPAEGETQAPLAFPDLLRAFTSILIRSAENLIEGAPEEHQEAVKDEIVDMLNYAATNALNTIDPDWNPANDLTAQAILQAENELLEAYDDDNDNIVQFPGGPKTPTQ